MSNQEVNETPSQAAPMEVAEEDSNLLPAEEAPAVPDLPVTPAPEEEAPVFPHVDPDPARDGDDPEALTDEVPQVPEPAETTPVERLRAAFEDHNMLDLGALVECIEALWGRKGGK